MFLWLGAAATCWWSAVPDLVVVPRARLELATGGLRNHLPSDDTVREARQMAEVARATGVATQVATGNSASEATRLLSEWIGAGAIGPVREVHNWSSRPFWPQGLERPEDQPPVPDS